MIKRLLCSLSVVFRSYSLYTTNMKNINLEYVSVDVLKPAEYNPRVWDEKAAEDLKKSITEYGFVDPLIVNKNAARENILVGGHFRLHVAKLLGIEQVPVVYVDIEDIEKEKKLNLRLNKNTGQFDWLKMKDVLSEEGLLEVGFSQGELAMMNALASEEIKVDESPLKHELATYLEGTIKQIVLFYSAEEFDHIIPKVGEVMEEEGLKNHTEVFNKAFQEYYANHYGTEN